VEIVRREKLELLVTGSLSDDNLIQLTLTSAVGLILGEPPVVVLTLTPSTHFLNRDPNAVACGVLQGTFTAARLITARREQTGHSTFSCAFIL
jgi:hypothetical protein